MAVTWLAIIIKYNYVQCNEEDIYRAKIVLKTYSCVSDLTPPPKAAAEKEENIESGNQSNTAAMLLSCSIL